MARRQTASAEREQGSPSLRRAEPSLGTLASSLVGRGTEIAEVSALIRDCRLVTLTGPGGVGKTRLALALVTALAASDKGSAYVDLAALEDAAFVPAAILASMGSRATAGQSPGALVADLIGRSRWLMVLDNFEHVIDAAHLVRDLLEQCPNLTVIATSRRRLRLSIERVYEVPPLSVPPRGDHGIRTEAYDSVRLFMERAAEAGGSIGPESVGVVAEICRRLEGLPLAIELAAAHARYLSAQAILGRLDEPLPLLSGGPVDAPARQRALRHSIAWSYDLLGEQERSFLCALTVFDGAFSLQAAHDIAGGSAGVPVETLGMLEALSDQGLIRAEPGGDAEARFRMHAAIRDFAEEAADDLSAPRDRMLDHYVKLAERAEPQLQGAEAAHWAQLLTNEMENIRGALAWAYKSAEADGLVRLAVALGNFWRWHGDLREGREWLSRAVLAAEPGNESLLSKAQRRAAKIYYTLGERDQALLLYRSARKNAEAAHDASGIAESLTSAAAVLIDDGRLTEAEALLDEGFGVAQQAGDLTILANALLERGLFESYRGNLDEAKNHLREAAETAETAGDLRLAAVALVNSADTEFVAGDYGTAVRLASKGASYLDACGDIAYAPWAHLFLGLAYGRLGNPDEAGREILVGGLKALDGGSPADVILGAEVVAEWLGAAGEHEEAVACWAAATDAREGLDFPRQPWDDVWIDAGIERDRSALPPDAASAAWNAGVALGVRAKVAAALEVVEKVSARADRSPSNKTKGTRTHDKKSLTPRELEVLRLVTDGRSDKEIAAALSISVGTATAHVASIKWKLDASGRVEIATTAITRGLVTVRAKQ